MTREEIEKALAPTLSGAIRMVGGSVHVPVYKVIDFALEMTQRQRAEDKEEFAKIAERNGWEATARQIREAKP